MKNIRNSNIIKNSHKIMQNNLSNNEQFFDLPINQKVLVIKNKQKVLQKTKLIQKQCLMRLNNKIKKSIIIDNVVVKFAFEINHQKIITSLDQA